MADAPPGSATTGNDRGWRMRTKIALLLVIVVVSIAGNFLYDRFARRSIIVQADTGTLRVLLEREITGKTFQNAIVCRRKDEAEVDHTLRGAPLGCSKRTHRLTPGAEETLSAPPAAEDAPRGESPAAGRETFDVSLPAGSRILLYSAPERISLIVEDVPAEYDGTDTALLEGGGITLTGPAIREFGSLVLTGRAVIGAGPSETDRVSVVEGSYQINGATWPTSALSQERQILRSGELRSGAYFYFQDRGECLPDGRTCFWNRWDRFAERSADPDAIAAVAPLNAPAAEARLTVTVPDPGTSLFRVTAISEYRPVLLNVLYYLSEPVSLRATIVNTLLADPILVFFATLLASGVGVVQFFAPRSAKD